MYACMYINLLHKHIHKNTILTIYEGFYSMDATLYPEIDISKINKLPTQEEQLNTINQQLWMRVDAHLESILGWTVLQLAFLT